MFRLGVGKKDAVLLFRAGPTCNHDHADQGAFLFRALGETLATEAGWSDYYKDPYYASYLTQAAGHNTVLVDGDPESQAFADTAQFRALDAYPRITDALLSETYHAVASNLAAVYKGRLSRYTRRLVFMKPDYLLVYDDLHVNGAPARFDWRLHLPNRAAVTASAGHATYVGRRASLAVRSLLPGADFEVREGRLPSATLAARTPHPVPAQPAILDLVTSSPAASRQLLVALVPARTLDAATAAANRATPIVETPWQGVQVVRGTFTDVVLFRAAEVKGAARHRDWSVDADAWSTTHDGRTLVQMAGHGLIAMSHGGRLVARADRPVSLVARYALTDVHVMASAHEATALTLGLDRAAVSVELDGKKVPARVNGRDRTVVVDMPAGPHRLRIVYRPSGQEENLRAPLREQQ